jgi:hypothetical protein
MITGFFPKLLRPHPNLVFYEILRVLSLSMILPENRITFCVNCSYGHACIVIVVEMHGPIKEVCGEQVFINILT